MMMFGSDASTCGARLFEPQPIERGHRNHRPGGTSQAQGSPAISGECSVSGRLFAPLERGAIDPDAVQDDGQFASNSDLCLLHAVAFRHSTAGHGGFYLSADRNAKVLPLLRKVTPWYEEDCEWAIVALSFPDLFTAHERSLAEKTIRNTWPDEWEAIHGAKLTEGESWAMDRRAFDQRHAADHVVISAIFSDQHPGMTEVVAVVGGDRRASDDERRFLVPSDEYARRGRFGFVIDPVRHAEYHGPSSFIGWRGRGDGS